MLETPMVVVEILVVEEEQAIMTAVATTTKVVEVTVAITNEGTSIYSCKTCVNPCRSNEHCLVVRKSYKMLKAMH